MSLIQSAKAWRLAAFMALTLYVHACTAQIMLPQYYVGEYRSDVVYVGSYYSPGYCNFTDGLDFVLNAQQLSLPTGIFLALIIDTPEPSTLALTGGWQGPINVGDSTTLVAPAFSYGIAALQQGTINFHLTASGTPTTLNDNYACWIDQMMTLSDCNNSWAVMNGESLIPCQVLPPQHVGQPQNIEGLTLSNTQLIWNGQGQLTYTLVDLTGRQIQACMVEPNSTVALTHNAGIYALTAVAQGQVMHRKVIFTHHGG